MKVLTVRQLNRATLARQMLLAREKTTARRAVERLCGLQAQQARPPFVGLWSRVSGFRREDLVRLLHRKSVVRATMMRATLHLVTAGDYLGLRSALQPALTRAMRSALRARADDFDPGAIVGEADAFFANPGTFDAFRATLAARRGDVRAMAYAARTHSRLVQVPTDATWGFPATAEFVTAEAWLGKKSAGDGARKLVTRYLAAFGPATVADAQAWSGLSALREAFEELRPKLRSFRDERGRELFDLPGAPRPRESTPAPVRLLPEFDNLVLAHADRRRVIADRDRPKVCLPNLRILATLLVDGFVAGTWKVETSRRKSAVVVQPFAALSAKAKDAIASESRSLLSFVEPDAEAVAVRFRKRLQ